MKRSLPKRRPSLNNPTPQQRAVVFGRAGGSCERCGRNIWKAFPEWHCHHRMLRSQGGSNGFQNLVALCSSCHELVHSQRLEIGEPEGWIVSGHGIGPRSIPVTHHTHGPTLLTPEGSYAPIGLR